MIKEWKQQNELYWLLAFSVLCFGGFYDWTAASLGAAVGILGIFRIARTRKLLLIKEKWIWCVLLQGICLVLASFTAVDRGMNFVGILRFLPVVLWLFLGMQYSEEERRSALNAVPHMGCLMICISLIALLIPGMEEWLWSAQRLGGFFQYSNTCAIFFLIGMMLLKENETREAKVQWCLLFWGILLTGSRTVMILLIAYFLIELFGKKSKSHYRSMILINVGLAIVAAILMVWIDGNYQNLARLVTVFRSNSTFYGRLLYWKDAIGLILKHPLGLGWKGYFYIQSSIQTGVYKTIYVHNDLLQSFLDGGWISGFSFLLLMIWQIKKSSHRLLLVILFLHCLVDVDFQYASIWFVAILLFDFGKEEIALSKEKRIEAKVYLGILASLCVYFVLPFGAEYLNRYDIAAFLYPGYTETKETLLSNTGNPEEAVVLADDILKQNPYSSIAYDAKALVAYAKGDIEEFAENKEKVLSIERYDITQYQDYYYLLKQIEAYALEQKDEALLTYCNEKYEKISFYLKKVENETSMLAWKLRDQPTFELEE